MVDKVVLRERVLELIRNGVVTSTTIRGTLRDVYPGDYAECRPLTLLVDRALQRLRSQGRIRFRVNRWYVGDVETCVACGGAGVVRRRTVDG
jgi:hypothetical protein